MEYVIFPFRGSLIDSDLLAFLENRMKQVTMSLARQSAVTFWIWNQGIPRSGKEAKAMQGFVCLEIWTLNCTAALAQASSTQAVPHETGRNQFHKNCPNAGSSKWGKGKTRVFSFPSVLIVQDRTDTGNCENLNIVFWHAIFSCCS